MAEKMDETMEEKAFREENAYIEETLAPRLEELRRMLSGQDARCELTLDEAGMPGILILMKEWPPLCLSIIEGEGDEPERFLFSAEIGGDPMVDRLRLLTPSDEVGTENSFMDCVRLFFSGRTTRVYPLADRLRAPLRDDGEVTDDGGSPLSEEHVRLLPRTGALLAAIRDSYAQDCALMEEGTPCVLCVDEDFVCVLCYEQTGEDSYLLHFRSDVPMALEGEAPEAFCRRFNQNHLFATAECGQEDLPLFEGAPMDEGETLVTFHACVLDKGPMKAAGRYEWLLSLFEDEVKGR